MAIERKPQSGKDDESYPTRSEFAHDRRHFLALLGVGAVTAAGAYAATSSGPPPPPPEPDPKKPPAKPKEPVRGDVRAPTDFTNTGVTNEVDAGSSPDVARPQEPIPGGIRPVDPKQPNPPASPAVPPRRLGGAPPREPKEPKPKDPDAGP